MKFHYCDSYLDGIADNIKIAVDKFIDKNKRKSNLKGIGKVTAFTKGLSVLKIKTPYAEIIFQERHINIKGKEYVVYFVRGERNGLDDYVAIRDGKWLQYNPLSSVEISNFTNSILNAVRDERTISIPPQNILTWQSDYKLKVEYNIFESNNWIKFAMSDSKSNGMKENDAKLYLLALKEVLKENKELITSIKKTDTYEIFNITFNDIGIVYVKVVLNNKNFYILENGSNVLTQNNHWEDVRGFTFENQVVFNSYTDISSFSSKAYPSWVVNDADLWVKIEKNNELGNLSLLPEQTEFLKKFKFPKYINGQAGSGKSTMLYYLFSNVYYYKYAGEIPGDIIFLTENEKLLDHTKKAVYDLLINNPEFDLSSEPDAIVNVDRHFCPFKKFLLELIPEDNNEFQADKYLDFSKFKVLYEKSNIQKHIKLKYSSELVWFTISTYINGYSLDFQITSENYDEKMPKEGKEIISQLDLVGMEKEIIFPFYNKLLENDGWWDKIKLIQYINTNIKIEKTFDVIFCDESQDFSKVELEFIMQLSTYAKYDLSNVDQYPIVFAGDALQTVNPTGFRSEVLTSMMYKELTKEETGYKLDQSKLVFTPSFNYRSSQSIVNVANSIQNYRKNELGANVQNPQVSKRLVIHQNEHLNVFVDIDAFSCDVELQNKVQYKTIIVPVNRDEIPEYKEEFEVLKKFKNIISAVDAKGLDFNEVVIFGFGDFIKTLEKEGLYGKRFFYNKLYVAVTRAQTELVIIDSNDSKTNFWKHLIENYINSDWAKEVTTDIEKFADIIIFETNEIIQSSDSILEKDAERQKNQGVLEENVPLLQVASSHFIKLGNKKQYFLCLAEIQKIKQNWAKAASFYLKNEVGIDGVELAVECYWEGKNWKKVIDIFDLAPNDANSLRKLIAMLFLESTLSFSDLQVLYERSSLLRKLIQRTSWRKEAVLEISSLLDQPFEKDELTLICDILEEICLKEDSDIIKKIANKYYSIGKFQSAVSILENNGLENDLYLKVKLELAKKKNALEEIIIFLGRIAIETDCDKKEIAMEVLEVYLRDVAELNKSTNTYTNLYLYLSLLSVDIRNENLLFISHKVEKIFAEKNGNSELASYYEDLLKENLIEANIFSFVLSRWVKNSSLSGVLLSYINIEYEKLVENNKFKYSPFTQLEVDKIDQLPKNLKEQVPKHIYNIEIKNFRKFENVLIENLGLINLVVGDNNIGKTSLLEALLFVPEKKEYLERLAFAYIDRINIHPDKRDSSKSVDFYYKINTDFLSEYENCNNNEASTHFNIFANRGVWNHELNYKFDTNIKKPYFSEEDTSILTNIPYNNGTNQPYIPYGKGYGFDLSVVYDSKIRPNKDLEQEFLKRLRIFIPNAEKVFVRTDGNIDIRDSDYSEDRQLSQYGEGANKLFRILILLTVHKGRLLLIDEIDAGIHFSRFKEFWRILLSIAEDDDTQIIATTHNDECIRFFKEVLSEPKFGVKYQSISRVVQMKHVNTLKIRSLEYESFNLAYEDGVEIRGGLS
jgi:AAA15 family ATPase/GTPase